MGSRVEFDAAGEGQIGYFAPNKSGSGPGVIVIQEWWGLVHHIESIADRFAEAGFTAFAPDFYKGVATKEPDEAGTLMMALDMSHAEEVVRGAAKWLLSQDSCSSEKVGVVGFCMGGQLALYSACLVEEVGACVNFYGVHPNASPDLAKLDVPLMGHFAKKDHMTTPAIVAGLEEKLKSAGKSYEFFHYDAPHAFFNDERPEVYDPASSKEAWDRTLAFFQSHLK